jgi:hypothetical protein
VELSSGSSIHVRGPGPPAPGAQAARNKTRMMVKLIERFFGLI